MHGKSKHAWFIAKDMGCTIALMHIKIYYQDLVGEAILQ
jgi:hypothetical protein